MSIDRAGLFDRQHLRRKSVSVDSSKPALQAALQAAVATGSGSARSHCGKQEVFGTAN